MTIEEEQSIDRLEHFLRAEKFDGNMIIELGGNLYRWTARYNLELIPYEAITAHLSGDAFVYKEDKE